MNTSRQITILSITIASLVLAACAADVGGPPSSDPTDDRSPSAVPSASAAPSDEEESSMAPSPSAAWITDVIAQAAEETGVNASDISVVVAEEVTWRDGSLGCPEEGMGYTQALVPGYRAVLEIGGEELHFHASNSGDFRLCEDPQPPANSDR